jgi:serine protease Do
MSLLAELEKTVQRTAERAGPAVVGLGRGWGVGSGTVIARDRVLTNAHNVRDEKVSVTFADGRAATGRVTGSDPDADIAVIEVDTGDIEPLPWLESGSADGEARDGATAALIGAAVLAMGNPGGRGLRVTPGFVSSAARSFRGPRGRRIAGVIEHSAPLPRGSSGGPLLDADGSLLGINTVRVDGGLILAIPADEALRRRVRALERGETPRRLGIALLPPHAARKLRRAVGLPEREGVLVRTVEEGSPASRAGLERGDLIVTVGGRAIERTDDLYESLEAARDANQLELVVLRGDSERSVTVAF